MKVHSNHIILCACIGERSQDRASRRSFFDSCAGAMLCKMTVSLTHILWMKGAVFHGEKDVG